MEFSAMPNTDSPPDQVPLLRYMSMLKLSNLLRTKALHLSTLAQLRKSHDAWEGARTEPRLRSMENFATRIPPDRAERYEEKLGEAIKHLREVTHVCCFNVHDDDLMSFWERYAPDGVAVLTRPARLQAAITAEGPAALLQVRYDDYAQADMKAGPYVLASTKRKYFSDEHEVRLVVIRRDDPGPVLLDVDLGTLSRRWS